MTRPALVEVYPHPALLRLMNAPVRLDYKASKAGAYCPNTPLPDRIMLLLGIWHEILQALQKQISGIDLQLPTTYEKGVTSLAGLKRFEDALDGLVCCWVEICYLEGRCEPFGDETSAIWVPT